MRNRGKVILIWGVIGAGLPGWRPSASYSYTHGTHQVWNGYTGYSRRVLGAVERSRYRARLLCDTGIVSCARRPYGTLQLLL